VSSLKFGGIRFVVYSNDHLPLHVHGFAGESEVIIQRKVLNTAAQHFEKLVRLWEGIHGKA
jgi:hypothetical protein